MSKAKTWVIEDHLCRHCGGRILRCVTGNGMTGGGNPIFKCADCGKASADMTPACLCWCGFHHKHNRGTQAYRCIPFSILQQPEFNNEVKRRLRNEFAKCGCDPDRGEVGIVLTQSFNAALNSKSETEQLVECSLCHYEFGQSKMEMCSGGQTLCPKCRQEGKK